METGKTRLVEEGNTIYEIDLDCMRKKEERWRREKETKKCFSSSRSETNRRQDLS